MVFNFKLKIQIFKKKTSVSLLLNIFDSGSSSDPLAQMFYSHPHVSSYKSGYDPRGNFSLVSRWSSHLRKMTSYFPQSSWISRTLENKPSRDRMASCLRGILSFQPLRHTSLRHRKLVGNRSWAYGDESSSSAWLNGMSDCFFSQRYRLTFGS